MTHDSEIFPKKLNLTSWSRIESTSAFPEQASASATVWMETQQFKALCGAMANLQGNILEHLYNLNISINIQMVYRCI